MTLARHAGSHHGVFRVALVIIATLWASGCGVKLTGGATRGGTAGVGGGFPPDGAVFVFDGGFSGFGGTFDSGLPCGHCQPPPTDSPLAGFFAPCCASTGVCGLTAPPFVVECLPRNAPGVSAPQTCPPAPEFLGGAWGCCTPAGWCGLALTELGLGCVPRSTLPLTLVDDPANNNALIPCFGQVPDAGGDLDGGNNGPCEWLLSNYCDPVATCARDQARCECPAGYADFSPGTETGVACRDVNECLLTPPPCGEDTCLNTPGSYECVPISAN